MTAPPITVKVDTSLSEAARHMQERNVRRLIVVDERGRIAGIVSRSDLLQVFLRTDEELRDEIVQSLIPAILLTQDDPLGVAVTWNIVTLTGEVDRKSDVELLTRAASELDGVVGVVDRLSYRWDDTGAARVQPVSLERTFRSV
jgi:CBS-domain-containing membrane protein